MSRSYREPWYVDSYGSKVKKLTKREANKRVRRTLDLDDGMAYRKLYDPWNIVDWKMLWDPNPHYYFRGDGEWTVFEPDPFWRVGRK